MTFTESLHRENPSDTPLRYPFCMERLGIYRLRFMPLTEDDASMGTWTVKICITILAVLLVILALPYSAVMMS